MHYMSKVSLKESQIPDRYLEITASPTLISTGITLAPG